MNINCGRRFVAAPHGKSPGGHIDVAHCFGQGDEMTARIMHILVFWCERLPMTRNSPL